MVSIGLVSVEEVLLHHSEQPLRELFDQLRTILRLCKHLLAPIWNEIGLTPTVAPWSPLTLEYDGVPLPLLVLWQY